MGRMNVELDLIYDHKRTISSIVRFALSALQKLVCKLFLAGAGIWTFANLSGKCINENDFRYSPPMV